VLHTRFVSRRMAPELGKDERARCLCVRELCLSSCVGPGELLVKMRTNELTAKLVIVGAEGRDAGVARGAVAHARGALHACATGGSTAHLRAKCRSGCAFTASEGLVCTHAA